MVTKRNFLTYKNRNVFLYVIENDYLEVAISDFGAIVYSFKVKSPEKTIDIALSAKTIDDYIACGAHTGGTIGRVANRIENAKFVLNGKTYFLDKNDGFSCLHGGFNPYDYRFFDAEILDDCALKLSLLSPDKDQGFPGELNFDVIFKLDKNSFIIEFFGQSKVDTLFSLTNHLYFNLNGEDSRGITDTSLRINADEVTLTDENLVINGKILKVENTVFDFRSLKPIGPISDFADENLKICGGFDHNFILNSDHAATAVGDKSGIRLDLFTDYPGLQFYSGNKMNGIVGKTRVYRDFDAFCLEPQYFPNAINVENFPKPILKAGEKSFHYIKYVIAR